MDWQFVGLFMQEIIDALARVIGAIVVAGGGIGLIVYAIFKVLSEKWLNAKFAERLAAYKHAQQTELEQLKFQINTLMDRTVKLHQREFDVVPEAWSRLNDAYGIASAVLSSLQRYADLDRMNPAHLEEFLEKTPLMNWQKEEIRSSAKKTDAYIKSIRWHHINEANKACREYHLYLRKNGIFIPPTLKTNFSKLDDLIFSAISEHESNEQHEIRPRMTKAGDELKKDGEALIKNLEQDVQDRLWNSQALTT